VDDASSEPGPVPTQGPTQGSTPGPIPDAVPPDDPRLSALASLIAIVDRLRDPGGCPWDLEQTEASMAPYAIEEAHELAEAIADSGASAVAAEAGDCLTVLLLICRIAEQGGRYDLGTAARAASEKLVRRHPHVFGTADAGSAGEVLESWEETKRQERAPASEDTSALAGVPRGLSALHRASRVCQKAVAAGFHWEDARGALGKVEEELAELIEVLPEEALRSSARPSLPANTRARVEHELGDLLMATAFLGGYLQLDPEALCKAALQRFEARFRNMEGQFDGPLGERTLQEMMAAWVRAKGELDGAGPTAAPGAG